MKQPGFHCDSCMKLGAGEELDRWWIVSENVEHGIARFSSSPFVSHFASGKGIKHACSRRCADKIFHVWVKAAKNNGKEFARYLKEQRYSFSAMFSLGEDED